MYVLNIAHDSTILVSGEGGHIIVPGYGYTNINTRAR